MRAWLLLTSLVFIAIAGMPPLVNEEVPVEVASLAMGRRHTCALTTQGKVKCWGGNSNGELGYGDDEHRGQVSAHMGNALPFLSLGATGALGISSGDRFSCAILQPDGEVKCWGYNFLYRLGYGDIIQRSSPSGEPTLDFASNGSVVQLAAHDHACALVQERPAKGWTTNHVHCWGGNDHGQLGLNDTLSRGSPTYVNIGLLDDGLDISQVVVGAAHSCALFNTGRVKCWGQGSMGALGKATPSNLGDLADEMGNRLPYIDLGIGVRAASLASGENHVCALLFEDTVKCWGDNSVGQLGQGDTLTRGQDMDTMGMYLPIVDLGINGAVESLAAGNSHTCALLVSGRIKCWGSDSFGQLGVASGAACRGCTNHTMGDALPSVHLDLKAIQVNAGGDASCAVIQNGSARCWGRNLFGHLGTGQSTSLDRPLSDAIDLGTVDKDTSTSTSRSTLTSTSTTALSGEDSDTTGETSDVTVLRKAMQLHTSGGCEVSEVQVAGEMAVARHVDSDTDAIRCTVMWAPTSRLRRLLLLELQEEEDVSEEQHKEMLGQSVLRGRRLQKTITWSMFCTLEIEGSQVVDVNDMLSKLDLPSSGFVVRLRQYLTCADSPQSISVGIDDRHPAPAGEPLAEDFIKVQHEEQRLVEILMATNVSNLTSVVGGFDMTALKLSKKDVEDAGGVLTVRAGGQSADIPASIFDSLGRAEDEVFFLTLSGISEDRNGPAGPRRPDVKALLNLNLWSSEGALSPVSGLAEPVLLTFATSVADAECVYWDPQTEQWSSQGMSKVQSTDSTLVCSTTHFTLFGTIVDSIWATFLCSQASLLSAAGVEALGEEEWVTEPATFALWLSVLWFMAFFVLAISLDVKRSRLGIWRDAHFLIPSGEEPAEDSAEAVVAAASAGTCEAVLEAFCAAVREIFDEFMCSFFEYWAEARDICEASQEGAAGVIGDIAGDVAPVGVDTGSTGAAVTVVKHSCFTCGLIVITRKLMRKAAHNNACASIWLHHEDDLEETHRALQETTSTNDVGSQSTSVGAAESDDGGGAAASAAAGGVSPPSCLEHARGSEQEQDEESNNVNGKSSNNNNNMAPDNSARLVSSRRIDSKVMTENACLCHVDTLRDSYSKSLTLERSHFRSWVSPWARLLKPWVLHTPFGSALIFSVSSSSTVRAFLVMCDLIGAAAITTAFMSEIDAAPSKSEDELCESEDVAALLGSLIAIGVGAGLLGALPVAVLSRLHNREFHVIDYVGSEDWRRRLRIWRVKDLMLWVLGFCYIIFCTFYIMLFFANVQTGEHGPWLFAVAIAIVDDIFLVPMVMILTAPFLVMLLITVLTVLLWKPRAEVLQMVVESAHDDPAREEDSSCASAQAKPLAIGGEPQTEQKAADRGAQKAKGEGDEAAQDAGRVASAQSEQRLSPEVVSVSLM